MLLSYYDNYYNDHIISSEYEDGTGTTEEFHQYMNSYVYGDSEKRGIYIRAAAPGINEYLEDLGLNIQLVSEYDSRSSAITKAIEKLSNGEPVIASMAKTYDAPYNHSVLIYRVQYDPSSPADTAVFTMNMGWKSGSENGQSYTCYVASAGWFYECGYIESTCQMHNMTLWQNADATYHCKYCRNCTYKESEMHLLYWDDLLNRCTKCGRTGLSSGTFG